jgi:hypothetical protein
LLSTFTIRLAFSRRDWGSESVLNSSKAGSIIISIEVLKKYIEYRRIDQFLRTTMRGRLLVFENTV